MTDRLPCPPYQSPLEDHPEHVQAIGMISIEVANLDYILGELLGVLLHTDPDTARVVYLTPRVAFGRLEILQNVLTESVRDGTEICTEIDGILKRATAILDRRHRMVHDAWGTLRGQPARMRLPRTTKSELPKTVELSELTNMIQEIRATATAARELTARLYASWPPYASLDNSGLPILGVRRAHVIEVDSADKIIRTSDGRTGDSQEFHMQEASLHASLDSAGISLAIWATEPALPHGALRPKHWSAYAQFPAGDVSGLGRTTS